MADPRTSEWSRRIVGEKVDTKLLGEKIVLPFSGRKVKNRFMKAPMTERMCDWPENHHEDVTLRGIPSPALINLYKIWGEGEIGIIVGGNLMVNYTAIEAYGNPIFRDNHDGRLEQHKALIEASKAHGSLFIAQLSHVGRQGGRALNPEPVSASDVQLMVKFAGNDFAKPRPLTKDEIKGVVEDFAESAFWCWKAGADGVQVHCAHGYLLAQFISPTTNKRTDEYGGTLENRSRIVFEIIDMIRDKVPDKTFSVSVKLNSVEFQDGGITTEDFQDLCMKLERYEVDFVDLSGGTFESRAFKHAKESTQKREAYFIEFAEMIRPKLKKTKVFVTGGFRTASGMLHAIESHACDGVGIGRPLAAEPYLCKELLEGKVAGALDTCIPMNMTTGSSGLQLHQIGKGKKSISDYSVEEEVERYKEAWEKQNNKVMAKLPKVTESEIPSWLEAKYGFEYLKV
ncbi:hypothetical protein BLS_005080 [Venturia inaequalis]|uniref:NADH:flavin oxidoreductase/NADH oxidase N-terminal domain-containing protein n=1 Tax=Venturia inaequalis TaxID=5025 RepID=A0A8H3UWS8_VENIN|nr:hypothetical protein BLS_005080 [Venturia inaequalis]KAE9976897.1 hypothetical protein EG328_002357 [Venturia inaequalis]KAE9991830.1 hypothetical protein EG327_010849 [Venturia inaequalis]RDI82791.1 hypothetical protein Vi05172_g7146 [Venturia inaequalis]